VAAAQAVNLTDVLSLPGPVDVFAPTNEAFAELLSSLDITAEVLLAQTELVTRVLQLHVVTGGAVCSGDLGGRVSTALAGEGLTVSGGVVTAGGSSANVIGAVDAGNGVVYLIDAVLLPTPSAVGDGASSPVAEGASAEDVFNALDADGDGLVTEAELRAAAEARGIQLTDGEVAAFLAADADGDGVDVDEYLTSLDTTVLGAGLQLAKDFERFMTKRCSEGADIVRREKGSEEAIQAWNSCMKGVYRTTGVPALGR
jgi:hypothetical protein